MRHCKKFKHLSRKAAHRNALLKNLAKSLIIAKRITTTVAKAKALRKFIEPILTKAKHDTMHTRRVVFSYFQDKVPVKIVFNEIVDKIIERPGGYTRIIRLGKRLGDHAEICMMELVDYNNIYNKETKIAKASTRTRRSKKKTSTSILSAEKNESDKKTKNGPLTALDMTPTHDSTPEAVLSLDDTTAVQKQSTPDAHTI